MINLENIPGKDDFGSLSGTGDNGFYFVGC
jgi:hypothetical protein